MSISGKFKGRSYVHGSVLLNKDDHYKDILHTINKKQRSLPCESV